MFVVITPLQLWSVTCHGSFSISVTIIWYFISLTWELELHSFHYKEEACPFSPSIHRKKLHAHTLLSTYKEFRFIHPFAGLITFDQSVYFLCGKGLSPAQKITLHLLSLFCQWLFSSSDAYGISACRIHICHRDHSPLPTTQYQSDTTVYLKDSVGSEMYK